MNKSSLTLGKHLPPTTGVAFHHLHEARFNSPTWCSFCKAFISSPFGKQGFKCSLCAYTIHNDCFSKAKNDPCAENPVFVPSLPLQNFFTRMPRVIFFRVARLATPKSLCRLARCSKMLSQLVKVDSHWEWKTKRKFKLDVKPSDLKSWLETFRLFAQGTRPVLSDVKELCIPWPTQAPVDRLNAEFHINDFWLVCLDRETFFVNIFESRTGISVSRFHVGSESSSLRVCVEVSLENSNSDLLCVCSSLDLHDVKKAKLTEFPYRYTLYNLRTGKIQLSGSGEGCLPSPYLRNRKLRLTPQRPDSQEIHTQFLDAMTGAVVYSEKSADWYQYQLTADNYVLCVSRDAETILCRRLDGDKARVEIRVAKEAKEGEGFSRLKDYLITLNGQLATLHDNGLRVWDYHTLVPTPDFHLRIDSNAVLRLTRFGALLCTTRHAKEDELPSVLSAERLKTWTNFWQYHNGKVKVLPEGDHGVVLDAHHGFLLVADQKKQKVRLVAAGNGRILYKLKGKFTIPEDSESHKLHCDLSPQAMVVADALQDKVRVITFNH